MPASEGAFVTIGLIGFLILLSSFVFGEIAEHSMEFGHDLEVPHEVSGGHELGAPTELQVPSWLSLRVLAASSVGFGAVGFIADFTGLPEFLSWPLAAVAFLTMGAGTYFLILKPLAAQQYNSLLSRYSYIGRDALVILDILPDRPGQVTFRDRQGARVTQTASSDLRAAVSKGATVRIVDLVPGGVVVHLNPFSD